MDNRSIGVFDSGLGGLTVVKELRKVLPSENIIYLGDTARVPYGNCSKEVILRYAHEDIGFLLSKDVKAIVVACATASSVLSEAELNKYNLPIVTIIKPPSIAAASVSKNGKIGVIATNATIKSGRFKEEILKADSSTEVFQKACPLFVPLVEHGYISRDNPALKHTIADYLTDIKARGIDTLVLGCTHYPMISAAIADFMGADVQLINAGISISAVAKSLFEELAILRDGSEKGSIDFFLTDVNNMFEELAENFLDEDGKLRAKEAVLGLV